MSAGAHFPQALLWSAACNSLPIFAVALKYMSRFILCFLVCLAFTACSEYNRILKKGSTEEKFEAAKQYYEEEECYRALPLLEELIGLTRGTTRAEEVYYYYAQVHYCIGDYYLGNYYFKNFTKSYPTSNYAEECLFLAAMCSYNLSPQYSLDQAQTSLAIEEFQVFIDRYPQTALKDSCNAMVGRLNDKLETKEYEVASLYVRTQQYKAARIALEELLERNPATPFREDVMFLLVQSSFEYAERSIDRKKAERYRDAIDSYLKFVAYFPESSRLREAEAFYKRSQAALEAMN